MNGANSTLANMGAGVVHGITYVAGKGTAAAAKGLVRGLGHLATGVNPLVASDDEEELVPDKPVRAYPKAKAQSRSSGSHENRAHTLGLHALSSTPRPTTERGPTKSTSEAARRRSQAPQPQEGLEIPSAKATWSLHVRPWEVLDKTLGEDAEIDELM